MTAPRLLRNSHHLMEKEMTNKENTTNQLAEFFGPQLTIIAQEIAKEVVALVKVQELLAANDNRRNVTDDNRHGALGRPPQNDREEMLARLDPEQIAATIGWDTFDKYANRRELRTRDVADFLGVSDWTVKSWRREGNEGKGPRYYQAVRGQGPAIYLLEDLIEYVESTRV